MKMMDSPLWGVCGNPHPSDSVPSIHSALWKQAGESESLEDLTGETGTVQDVSVNVPSTKVLFFLL